MCKLVFDHFITCWYLLRSEQHNWMELLFELLAYDVIFQHLKKLIHQFCIDQNIWLHPCLDLFIANVIILTVEHYLGLRRAVEQNRGENSSYHTWYSVVPPTRDRYVEVSTMIEQNPDESYSYLICFIVICNTSDFKFAVHRIVKQDCCHNYAFLMWSSIMSWTSDVSLWLRKRIE
jgi:hypothetical protein